MSATVPEPAEIQGAVHSIVFHNEENGYTIMQVATGEVATGEKAPGEKSLVTVLGNLPAVTQGEEIKATGRWRKDRRFGRQFQADHIQALPPHTSEGIERFLASGLVEGVGKTYAKRIVDRFGEDTFRVIEEESQKLEQVPGIGKARRLRIKESWKRQKAVRDVMIFLHEHGLSTARALRLYKTYGEEAANVLRQDPYRLARELPGVGFRTADDIARKMGRDPNSPQRLGAGIQYVLQQAERNGHCALPRAELIEESVRTLDCAAEDVEGTLNRLVLESCIVVENFGGATLVFPVDLFEAEGLVAESVARLLGGSPSLPAVDADAAIAWFERHQRIQLGDEQREAVLAATRHRFSVVTGGPGVGKTTILDAVLRILTAKKVASVLCAPTGRAAKRLTESTGHEAFTIHRLLEYQPGVGFTRTRAKPLQGDLFVVDEASMVDVRLMANLLSAIPEHGSVVLVGDVDQLPSVGPGNVLRDIVDSGVAPVSRLHRIYRQRETSRIVTAAHEVNRGARPALDNAGDSDFFFIERNGPETIAETLRHLVSERIPEGFGLDPRDEVQVLTPMNRRSLGTQELNRLLQSTLNPPAELKFEIERFGILFRTGDKVIQTRNNYEKDVFNGDIGHIAEITTEPVSIHVTFEGNRRVHYEPGELDELQLAYAITIHKSQGSEFPAVVIPLASQHYVLLQRNLLYTAMTRGKRLVIIVGETKALDLAVQNRESSDRYSGLKRRLETAAPAETEQG
ncbi:MAG: ATP-dependent RecD-like DNA helicase [Verrucomicrobiales bacterium]